VLAVEGQGTKLAGKVSKLSLKLENGPVVRATKLSASDPDMPLSWSATFKGKQATMNLIIEQITRDDNLGLDFSHRVYGINGTGSTKDGYDITIEGLFFFQ
jgi:hypothetical protein